MGDKGVKTLGVGLGGGSGDRRVETNDGNNEVVFGHEVVFDDKSGESLAEEHLVLELIEERLVVEEGVAEDTVDPAAHGSQLSHR